MGSFFGSVLDRVLDQGWIICASRLDQGLDQGLDEGLIRARMISGSGLNRFGWILGTSLRSLGLQIHFYQFFVQNHRFSYALVTWRGPKCNRGHQKTLVDDLRCEIIAFCVHS